MESMIQVSGLRKTFGNFTAVDHIDFEVRKGEIFGFLGPNGAGKTTTQRLLTGIIKPTSGEITIMGHDLLKDSFKAKMLMGIVPETANTYVDMSAWHNLMLMGQLYGYPKKKRVSRSNELLENFGLLEKKNQKTKYFSKGMKQRLLLAMALIHEPDLMFLDEPTSGLDVQSTRLIRDIINTINQEGKTIFLTTHNIEEAALMCDRIAIINEGKIAAIDTPAALKSIISSSESVEVAFDKPINRFDLFIDWKEVSDFRKTGQKYRLYSDQPGELACLLVEYAKTENLKLLSLNTRGPSLEDVFVYLTTEKDN